MAPDEAWSRAEPREFQFGFQTAKLLTVNITLYIVSIKGAQSNKWSYVEHVPSDEGVA